MTACSYTDVDIYTSYYDVNCKVIYPYALVQEACVPFEDSFPKIKYPFSKKQKRNTSFKASTKFK